MSQKNEKSTESYLPYPATDENKIVCQLDDVTKESEKKATQIFDILDNIGNKLQINTEHTSNMSYTINKNIKLFTTLSKKFPDVKVFKTILEKNSSALIYIDEVFKTLETSQNSILDTIDIMQYQDIHRQKIERVINVMRSLSNYTNNILESKTDDKKRVSSAQHINGDLHNELASEKEIEILLKKFAKIAV